MFVIVLHREFSGARPDRVLGNFESPDRAAIELEKGGRKKFRTLASILKAPEQLKYHDFEWCWATPGGRRKKGSDIAVIRELEKISE